MPIEDLLIRYCVQIDIDNISEKIKEVLSPDLNWAYFLERAESQGIISLVYQRLSNLDYAVSIMPGYVRERLERGYYTIAARNTLLYDKLNNILSFFNQAKIEVIILKGIALAQTIYPDIALRPMYDIDILIQEKDLSLVQDGLRGLGYTNSSLYPEDFYKDDIMVDVHWDIMNITRVKSRKKSYQININEIWRDSRPIEINGQQARILSPEHCLINLCLHLVLHHGLSGLIRFVDIARLIEFYKSEIDWDNFIQDAFKYKICKPVYYTLYYVKENLGQEIPQFVLEKLVPKKQGFLERKIFDLILSGASLENIRFFFTLSAMGSFIDQLRFLREIILPSPKVLSLRHKIVSAWHIPRCYLLHFKSILSSILKLTRSLKQAGGRSLRGHPVIF